MIPHVIGEHDQLLAVDFAAQRLLVGETTVSGRDRKRVVFRHARWTLRYGTWHQEYPRRNQVQCPPIDADTWRDAAGHANKLAVQGARASLAVERSDLYRALGHVSALTRKSLDRDGLLTLSVSEPALLLRTHGDSPCSAVIPSARADELSRGAIAAETFASRVGEFGSVVVLAEYLRAVVKDLSGRLSVVIDPRSRELVIGGVRVWTAAVEPRMRESVTDAVDLGGELAQAAVRAMPFASNDPARVNLHRVRASVVGEQVYVEATDGHRAYRERVDVHPDRLADKPIYFPRTVLKRFAKQAAGLKVQATPSRTLLASGDFTVAVPRDDHSFPPVHQVINIGEPYTVPARLWQAWRDALSGDTVKLQFVSHRQEITAVGLCWEKDHARADRWNRLGDAELRDPALLLTERRPEVADPLAYLRAVNVRYLAEVLGAFGESDEPLTLCLGHSHRDSMTFSDATKTIALMPLRPEYA